MLKKVFFEPERTNSLKLDSIRCSICKGVPTKTVVYVCKSSHVVCKACMKTDEEISEKEHVDVMTQKGELTMNIISEPEEVSCHNHNDLASGDHHHSFKCLNTKSKSMSFSNIQSDKKMTCKRKSVFEEGINFKHKETMVKFLNDNFRDSESSFSCPNNENDINKDESKKNQCNCKASASSRPVRCPVAECHKILAQDSVLKHFYFDHSKIPRITINYTEPYQVFIQKIISDKILCYAIFLAKTQTSLSHTDSVAVMNGDYKNSSFLLMGVRMPCASAEIIKKPHGNNSASVRHVQTQTDSVETKSSKVDLKPKIALKLDDHGLETLSKSNDTLMLWICKLGDSNYYYNISVTSVDKKLGFSVIGETISIRECQTSKVINDHLGCLFIRGKAANKLANEQDQLEICVSIFK